MWSNEAARIAVSLINEFAPKHARATMVILFFTGVTFGGGLPGLIAAKFMAVHGWRILFWIVASRRL
jgi:MFS transporter, AAHS family, 4-hydroxybenzoate transporter